MGEWHSTAIPVCTALVLQKGSHAVFNLGASMTQDMQCQAARHSQVHSGTLSNVHFWAGITLSEHVFLKLIGL